jgi:hypothetical protein
MNREVDPSEGPSSGEESSVRSLVINSRPRRILRVSGNDERERETMRRSGVAAVKGREGGTRTVT